MTDMNANVSPALAGAIAKVQRLLALTKNNTSENEVKAAAAAADRIMQEYRITQAMLESQGSAQAEEIVRRVVSEGGRRTAWREVLLHALSAHYGCAFYFSSHRSGGEYGTKGRKGSKGVQMYTVVGQKSDTEIVAYMFAHLEGEVERLCRWHCGGEGVKFAMSWQVGCAGGISAQFSDMRAAARAQAQSAAQEAGTSAALVLLDKRGEASQDYMRTVLKTKVASAVHGAQDYNARAKGYDVGKKVQIRQGLPSAATTTPKLGT